jgi:hypothetical protein
VVELELGRLQYCWVMGMFVYIYSLVSLLSHWKVAYR